MSMGADIDLRALIPITIPDPSPDFLPAWTNYNASEKGWLSRMWEIEVQIT